MVCKPAPSLIPLDVLVPLLSWSRPGHSMKKIKILMMYLYCECMNNRYECKYLNIYTIHVPGLVRAWKRPEWAETSHATYWLVFVCVFNYHSLLYYIRSKHQWVQESSPILVSYWLFTTHLWLNDCDCFGLGLLLSLVICYWICCSRDNKSAS